MLYKPRFAYLILLAVMAFSFAPTPLFASAKEELEQTKKEMEQEKAKEAGLAEENTKLEDELTAIQEKLVVAAADVQKSEAELSTVEEKLHILDVQLAAKKEVLEKRHKHLAALVQAALRLSQTPPEAVVLMPGDSVQTMKAARALKMASNSVKEEAEAISLQVAELTQLQEKVTKQRDILAEQKKVFDKAKQALVAELTKRRKLQEKLSDERQQEAEKIAHLARQADDLQGLLSTIAKASKDRRAGGKSVIDMPDATPGGQKGNVRSFITARGHIRPPLAGKIVQYFGSLQGKNETSKGITILARTGAQVTAPYDGEVVFAGTFLGYGKMVIIRHSDDFHTLLAGLTKIETRAGEFLLEGEPIGAMGEREQQTQLYVELRKDNQPVDPAPWIDGLKKSEE